MRRWTLPDLCMDAPCRRVAYARPRERYQSPRSRRSVLARVPAIRRTAAAVGVASTPTRRRSATRDGREGARARRETNDARVRRDSRARAARGDDARGGARDASDEKTDERRRRRRRKTRRRRGTDGRTRRRRERPRVGDTPPRARTPRPGNRHEARCGRNAETRRDGTTDETRGAAANRRRARGRARRESCRN